jgi:peptidoglycan/LPS O-acetylase OafA/YrhL
MARADLRSFPRSVAAGARGHWEAVGVLLYFREAEASKSLSPTASRALALASLVAFSFCGMRQQPPLVIALECASSAIVVMLVAYQMTAAWFRILDLSIIRFYGRISYSFYLYHMIRVLLGVRLL